MLWYDRRSHIPRGEPNPVKRLTSIASFLTSTADTIRTAMARLNDSPRPFRLIVDEAGRLAGVLTDGDIRRAILAGATLDDSVERWMKTNPKFVHDQAKTVTQSLSADISFLPVLDGEQRPVAVIVATTEALAHPQPALIMAGGLGTRLGERTRTTPKPLLPVNGRPILDYILERLEDAGVEQIWIAVHHLAGQIEEFINHRDNRAEVRLVHERERLGTAGAISLLPERPSHPLLVLNGDILTQLDFRAFQNFHLQQDFDATIAVAYHRVQIPYGVVRHDQQGVFLGIEEKPTLLNFVAAGLYLLSPSVLSLIQHQNWLDMPDLLNDARAAGLSIGVFPIHEYWADVGSPADLEAAEAVHSSGVVHP